MKILLHICCANCAIYPLQRIREKGDEALGYFFNPNIHPYQEYQKRLESTRRYSEAVGLEVISRDESLLEEFLENISHRVKERCHYCYLIRLEATAQEAKKNGFDFINLRSDAPCFFQPGFTLPLGPTLLPKVPLYLS